MNRTRYYVGLVTRGGEPVSPEAQASVAAEVASQYGGGCTLYHATGYWEGEREPSLVLEALHDEGPDPDVVALELAELADQSAVLWTFEEVTGNFAKRKDAQ